MNSDMQEMTKAIQNIDKTLAVNTALLGEHIRRTCLLEERMETVDTHVKMVNGIVKFVLALGAIKVLWTLIIK